MAQLSLGARRLLMNLLNFKSMRRLMMARTLVVNVSKILKPTRSYQLMSKVISITAQFVNRRQIHVTS